MKVQTIFKGKLMLALFLFLQLHAISFANEFILKDEIGFNPKASEKILEIGSEVKSKTGISIFVYSQVKSNFLPDMNREQRTSFIKKSEADVISKISGSYVLIFLSLEDPHINMFVSDDLKNVVDKDSVLDDYIVPLLASKDKNSLISKYSAAVLNGYAEIADRIAEAKKIKLNSSFGSSASQASTIWKMFMYTMIIGGLLLYAYAVLRSKKNV